MAEVRRAGVVSEPISVRDVAFLVADRAAGALVSFSGDVRDHDRGRQVAHLEYLAHPSAAAVMAQVASDVAARHDVIAVAVLHQVGPLQIGDSALVVAVTAHHRAAAFAACFDLVEETKARIPVWKHQVYADGTDEWVNCA